jgi:UDP-glucose 4-epimerase
MEINQSRILVTGGCGLIGSTTIDLLLREYLPAQIVILGNLSRGTLENVKKALRDEVLVRWMELISAGLPRP